LPPRRLTYSPEYDFGGRGSGRVAALAKWLKIFDFSRVWSFAIASYVKIDQKTNFAFGQSQIRKQLCFMNWGKIVHRLDFNLLRLNQHDIRNQASRLCKTQALISGIQPLIFEVAIHKLSKLHMLIQEDQATALGEFL